MSGPVDVLAWIDGKVQREREIERGTGLPNEQLNAAIAARAAVDELITELRHAHEIIKLALHHVPAGARTPWFLAIDDAGLCGDGVTRFHERNAALANIGSAA